MANNTLNLILNLKDDASAGLKRFQDNIKGSTKQAKELGKAMTVTGIAIAGTLGLAVKEFADFESGMSNVKAITNSTGQELEDLTALAKEMGRTTVFSAKESAEAMKFLGMAGFNTQEIMQSLEGTLNLAAASGIDLGRAADIASNILTGFRLDAGETDRVVDLLASTISSSNVDMEQMSEAMKFFAPTAASFGVSIEEASAVVGVLGNAGLQGSIATRALATSMNRLADPTKKMRKTMRKLNLEFFDSEGSFIGVTSSVKMLEESLKDSTDEQKAAAISTIFGQQALKQWNVLLAAGSDELSDYTGKLNDVEGAAQRMADTQLDNLSGSMKLLKSAVSGLAIEIGSKLAPTLRKIADFVTDVTSKMINWAEANPGLAEKIIVVVTAIGALMITLGPLLIMLPGLISLFAAISTVAGVVGATFTLLAGPFGLVVLAIGALIAAGIYLVVKWEEVGTMATEIWGSITTFISESVEQVTSFVSEKWEELSTGTTNIWNSVRDFLVGIFNSIATSLSAFYEKWRNWIIGITGFITGLFLPMMIKMAIQFSINLAKMAISATIHFAKITATFIVESAKWVANMIVSSAKLVATKTASLVKLTVITAINLAKITATYIAQSIRWIATMAITSATMVAQWAFMSAQALFNAARMAAAWLIALGPVAWITAIVVSLAALIIANWEAIVKWTKIKWTKISADISSVIEWLSTFLSDSMDTIKGVWKSSWESVGNIVDDVWGNIKTNVKSGINWIIDKINFFVRQANKITSKGNIVPGVNIPMIPEIPKLAKGGIVNSPTLAMVGEDGPEAVIPLSKKNNPAGIGLGGGGITIVINGDISGEEMLEKVTNNIVAELKLHTAIV